MSKEPRLVKINFPEVELNSQQKRQWQETLAAVNWIAPGFTHVLYTMLNKRGDTQVACFTEALQGACAATDGSQLIFKPSEFFQLNLMKRVFAVCHEISHCIADHCGTGYLMKKRGEIVVGGKKYPYDQMTANIVQDLIINDMLIEAKFGEFDKRWLHDPSVATYKDDWVEVYAKQYKKPPPQGGKGNKQGQGQGKGKGQGNSPGNSGVAPGQFDQHLEPGSIDDKAPEEAGPRNEQEWQQAVAGAQAVARAQGKCPASLEMFFGEMLEPKVDWRDHLKSLIARKVGSGGYDFRRPDRRLVVRDIIAPGRSGHGAGTVVIGMDSSGSIYADPTLIDRWMGELTGIMEDVRPKQVYVVWCDAQVQRVDELNDPADVGMVRMKGAKGGGGTCFEPVFDWVEEQGISPDCLLYLTDSYGSFPKEAPKYAVIWGDISGSPKNYPFGEVVPVPIDNGAA